MKKEYSRIEDYGKSNFDPIEDRRTPYGPPTSTPSTTTAVRGLTGQDDLLGKVKLHSGGWKLYRRKFQEQSMNNEAPRSVSGSCDTETLTS